MTYISSLAREIEREWGVKRIFSVNENCFKMTAKKKMKPLLPSLKERKRYLVFEVVSKSKLPDFSQISKTLKNTCSRFLGEIGMAKAGFYIMKDKSCKNKGIIRMNHNMVDSVKAALTMVKDIGGVDVVVQSRGVSGILKKAESKFMRC